MKPNNIYGLSNKDYNELKELYPKLETPELSKMYGLSVNQINGHFQRMGLRKQSRATIRHNARIKKSKKVVAPEWWIKANQELKTKII